MLLFFWLRVWCRFHWKNLRIFFSMSRRPTPSLSGWPDRANFRLIGKLFSLGNFLLNYNKLHELFFRGKSHALILDKKRVGLHFGWFLANASGHNGRHYSSVEETFFQNNFLSNVSAICRPYYDHFICSRSLSIQYKTKLTILFSFEKSFVDNVLVSQW
jgi:hypothetical protein